MWVDHEYGIIFTTRNSKKSSSTDLFSFKLSGSEVTGDEAEEDQREARKCELLIERYRSGYRFDR